jgi:hypothetical protein
MMIEFVRNSLNIVFNGGISCSSGAVALNSTITELITKATAKYI